MFAHAMRTTLNLLMVVVGVFGVVAVGRSETPLVTDAAPSEGRVPRIAFERSVYDFGKVNAGEVVKHAFVFTNAGKATLQILDVRPGCGCTTAGVWDKQVEPGKTGSIPLQFNSANFGGKVTKVATVTCNDASQSNIVLQITGTVWKPIDVAPTMAYFTLLDESPTNETKVIRITSNLDVPLTLSDLECTNQSFKAELKTVRPGKEFELLVTTVLPFTTPSVSGLVKLKTSAKETPEILITAFATVQARITVMPAQIMLPAGPLAAANRSAVTIRNIGTNTIQLSEARINVPNAGVTLQELQAGHMFSVAVNFPVGFELQPDQKIEVTVKSTDPKFPVIKVPVYQQPRVAAAATQTAGGILPPVSPTKLVPVPAVPAAK